MRLFLQLLHSLDEDDNRSVLESPILPKDKEINDIRKGSVPVPSPLRHSSLPAVSIVPVSASPNTNSKFVSKGGANGQLKNSPTKV